ncbi:MAG: sigma-70 family RNA polymerase sigma factor [Bacteroidales bacterium]|nr:sigma-70 family RNA polymerase sigma factor [Bacteroidales bacterium]
MVISTSTTKDIDEILVRNIREHGDRTAFSQLVNKYQGTVFSFCYRYTGNRQDAEDIAQDVFIKVFNKIGSFRGEAKFSTWLYSIMVNTCSNYSRWTRNKRMNEMATFPPAEKEDSPRFADFPDHSGDPEQKLLNKELGQVIQGIIARLRYQQRSVVIMKDFQGKSYEEIAGIMKMNMGTVKSTLSRGRLAVAKKMKEYLEP